MYVCPPSSGPISITRFPDTPPTESTPHLIISASNRVASPAFTLCSGAGNFEAHSPANRSTVACGSGAAVTERVRDVTPFAKDGSLRAGVRVTETKHGTCEPGSDALPNDVYRCNFANYVVDPCWRDRHAVRPSVVCLIRPWDTTALRILLSARLPQSTGQADLRAEPWAIRLRTGKRCIVLQGAHDTVTGKGGGGVIDYSCGSNLFLIRGIDRRQKTWRIRAARSTPHAVAPYSFAGWVPIETAWFGGNN